MYLIFLFEVSTNLFFFFFFLVEKILIILNVNLIYKKKLKKKFIKERYVSYRNQ